jgi:NAD(P)-dependent dehydrogenase (short-subunit alcohol dehydrogenase family)
MDVLVSGADTAVGRAVAEAFRAAGHEVVISGVRREELELLAKELDVEAIVCDSTDPISLAQARSLFPQHLDVIVTVPATGTHEGDPRTFTVSDTAAAWRSAFDRTVLSAALTVQNVGDQLRSGGSIVTVVPDAADAAGPAPVVKAALSNWTAGQADHFGTRGITINTVACGRGPQSGYEGLSTGGTATSTAIARLALFLTTPAARHITGQTLHVGRGTTDGLG